MTEKELKHRKLEEIHDRLSDVMTDVMLAFDYASKAISKTSEGEQEGYINIKSDLRGVKYFSDNVNVDIERLTTLLDEYNTLCETDNLIER